MSHHDAAATTTTPTDALPTAGLLFRTPAAGQGHPQQPQQQQHHHHHHHPHHHRYQQPPPSLLAAAPEAEAEAATAAAHERARQRQGRARERRRLLAQLSRWQSAGCPAAKGDQEVTEKEAAYEKADNDALRALVDGLTEDAWMHEAPRHQQPTLPCCPR
jgi:hypothetical protein